MPVSVGWSCATGPAGILFQSDVGTNHAHTISILQPPLPVGLAVGFVGLGTPVASHDATKHAATNLSRLGKVEFKVECNAAAQQAFNRAMALYHSFAWKPAGDTFAAVAKADPSCGMAHWGRAMVLLDNPFLWPGSLPPAKLNEIAAALDAARSAGLKSEREKAYVEAVATFVRDHDKVDYRTRLNAYDAAMAKLAAGYPNDKEASILSALVTSANFDPADKTYANQLKAAKVLEPLFVAQPNHPGVAHYLIHSYDYPPIAKHGLEAAKRYAKIAPDATHALHMPSHIFTRVGYWQESIEANRASAKAAPATPFDAHHAADYMVYAHLQLGQDKAARAAMNQSRSSTSSTSPPPSPMPRCRRAGARARELEGGGRPAVAPTADAYPWSQVPASGGDQCLRARSRSARSGDSAAPGRSTRACWRFAMRPRNASWAIGWSRSTSKPRGARAHRIGGRQAGRGYRTSQGCRHT